MVTNDEEAYKLADSYSDHGHDHIGSNRGMENHPILGFNYDRIGEINAAIGLAQARKIPQILHDNKKNKAYLMEQLKGTKGVSFAAIPDPSGDSATFLNILFDTPALADKVVKQMQADGVGGFNYWFTNMYHFINQWTHIKEMKTAAKLAIQVLGAPQDYKNLALPTSQEVIGRLVSFGIRCTWTKEETNASICKVKQRSSN